MWELWSKFSNLNQNHQKSPRIIKYSIENIWVYRQKHSKCRPNQVKIVPSLPKKHVIDKDVKHCEEIAVGKISTTYHIKFYNRVICPYIYGVCVINLPLYPRNNPESLWSSPFKRENSKNNSFHNPQQLYKRGRI